MARVFKYSILIGLLAVVLFAASADARSPRWRPGPPRANFSVTLVGDGGERLQTFSHHGQTFVLGRPGRRYSIRVHNPTAQRVEAVISVDGRDALSGEVADFVQQRGYVVPPFGSVVVDGFRTSLERVATFRFTDPSDSYSARMGTPQNVGVIGVAFFTERVRPRAIARDDRRFRPPAPKSAAPGRASKSRESADSSSRGAGNLGTEFGEGRDSSVVEVSFQRMSPTRPEQLISVRYDDAEGLEARGIAVFQRDWRSSRVQVEPRAFPRSRFAQPPN
jgi:hypothetical protein